MPEVESLRRENEALRTRFARMTEACRRVAESLDIETVLQEVVDGARSLTDARYGILGISDRSGRVNGLTVSGFTPAERERLGGLPEWSGEEDDLVRLAEVGGCAESVGLPTGHPTVKTFLSEPVQRIGERVGRLYLTEKEGGREFTAEDEEALEEFAGLAASAIVNARMYEDEARARGEAEEEREQLDALIRTSPVGVLVVDARTRTVISVNHEAQRIIGLEPEPGTPLEQFQTIAVYRRIDGQEYPAYERPLSRALRLGETVRAEEILFDRPDGQTITVLINATPIYSESGEIVEAVAVFQDMTPLEEMQRMRNEFLAMVSHELRPPLTVIKGSSATVLSASTPFSPTETTRFFRTIDEQADRLSELVGNLLDATKIEAGALDVVPRPTEVEEPVSEAVNTFRRGGAANEMVVELSPDLPRIAADPARVRQVLNNLLSNASKYSPARSTIRVGASVRESYVAISVSDEGQGVPADQLSHLFGKFSRIRDYESEDSVSGHGLGLAICKGIVEAHGGRIWWERNASGTGSRFTFTIPTSVEAETEAARSHTLRNGASATGGRIRVLYLDDDPHILRYVRNTLSDAGFFPITTSNPHEMLHLLDMERPHLVLLDLRLPGTDGFEIMGHIRENSDTPVIFLSGSGGDEDIVRALEMGASDYIVKPFSPTELIARINTALRKRSALGEPAEREPYQFGDLAIDYRERNVIVCGSAVRLTATEYRLLFELSTNAGRALTHDQLLQRVWGTEYSGEDHLLRVFVGTLRNKLGDNAKRPRYIFTEPGVGYSMAG